MRLLCHASGRQVGGITEPEGPPGAPYFTTVPLTKKDISRLKSVKISEVVPLEPEDAAYSAAFLDEEDQALLAEAPVDQQESLLELHDNSH